MVKVQISADKTDFDRKIDAVDSRLNRLGKNARGASPLAGLMGRGGAGGGGIGAIAGLLGKVGGLLAVVSVAKAAFDGLASSVQKAGEWEGLQMSMRIMLQDGKKAQVLLEQLRQYEPQTPLTMDELAGGARQLLAFGVTAENVTPTLRMLGDVYSAMQIPLNEIVDIFGRNRVQGTLFTKDIREFLGRGIPITKELAKQLGATEDRIMDLASEGKISAAMMEQAFRTMTSAGGIFYGQTAAASQTLAGKTSTLVSAFDELKRRIGTPFLGATKWLADMTTSLTQATAAAAKFVGFVNDGDKESMIRESKSDYQLVREMEAEKEAAKQAQDRADAEAHAMREGEYYRGLEDIRKKAALERLSIEGKISELAWKQNELRSLGQFDEALKVAEEVAKLERSKAEKEAKAEADLVGKKLRYEEQIAEIADERRLAEMTAAQQIAEFKRREAAALAEQDYEMAGQWLERRARIEETPAPTATPSQGVADSLRRNGALSGGYFAPRIQERTLAVAEASKNYLQRIADNTANLKSGSNGWTALR